MPAAPGIVNDGDFNVARQNGDVDYDYPFASALNDFSTFIARRRMRVESGYFRMPLAMSQRNFPSKGIGYLVDVTKPTTVEGTNLQDYDEVYASLPPTQEDYGTATASIQVPFLATVADVSEWIFVTINDSFDAVFVYEYSLNQPLPQIYRGKLVQSSLGVGQVISGYSYNRPPPNGRYLAQNSTSSRWMGSIFRRETVYVIPPPITKYKDLPLPP